MELNTIIIIIELILLVCFAFFMCGIMLTFMLKIVEKISDWVF